MPDCFWFAAYVDSREGVDYADIGKKEFISTPAMWFYLEKPTSLQLI